MDKEYRVLAILQIFTIFLVLKGISATYWATQYSMKGYLSIVEKYSNMFLVISPFLLIPLILMSIPFVFKTKEKTQRVLDIISLVCIFAIMVTFLIF